VIPKARNVIIEKVVPYTNGCKGCIYEKSLTKCGNAKPCMPQHREDYKNVIFISEKRYSDSKRARKPVPKTINRKDKL
jgi:hypothetical protein